MRITRTGLIGLACTACIALSGESWGQQRISQLWAESSGANGWDSRHLSLGNGGSELFTQLNDLGMKRRLFDSTGGPHGSLLWEAQDSDITLNQRVASSQSNSFHLAVRDENAASGHRLRLRAYGATSVPIWEKVTPLRTSAHSSFWVRLTGDETQVVLGVPSASGTVLTTYVYQMGTGALLRTIQWDAFGAIANVKVDRTGQRLLILTGSNLDLIDLQTGSLVNRIFIGLPGSGKLAVDEDFEHVAVGVVGGVLLYRRGLNGELGDGLGFATGVGVTCQEVQIPSSGGSLAVASASAFGLNDVVLRTFSIDQAYATGQLVPTGEYSAPDTGSLPNWCTSIEFVGSGEWFVAGLWGDGAGPGPELLAMSAVNASLMEQVDLGGSAQRVCLAENGTRLATSSRLEHSTIAGSGSQITAFDTSSLNGFVGLGENQIAVELSSGGVPSLHIRAGAPAGSPVRFVVSRDRLDPPAPIGMMGLAHVNRNNVIYNLPMGMADANGQAERTWQVPAFESGQTLVIQTLSFLPRRLSENYVEVTVP